MHKTVLVTNHVKAMCPAQARIGFSTRQASGWQAPMANALQAVRLPLCYSPFLH